MIAAMLIVDVFYKQKNFEYSQNFSFCVLFSVSFLYQPNKSRIIKTKQGISINIKFNSISHTEEFIFQYL